MKRRPDLSILPRDLAELYAPPELGNGVAQLPVEQLALEVDSPAEGFRRWLESQPTPDWMATP